MKHLEIPERLLTWLDVERVFKEKSAYWTQMPPGIISIRCFPDGADIQYSGTLRAVQEWLVEAFARAFDVKNSSIRLRIGDCTYPLTFEVQQSADQKHRTESPTYPLWREVAYLQESPEVDKQVNNLTTPVIVLPQAWETTPRVVSFHSFKGGVGRTTSLMTYVAAKLESAKNKSVKILVVDADLEAPGVSFWLDRENQPQVSFIQFLEAMHYPPVDAEASLDYFASELRKTSLTIDGTLRELFVLPAALDLTEILDMPVQPAHLARNTQNPWVLTEHIKKLGEKLGVDTVFIDLRAGLSELASPILFDPRVEHFFVTTVAIQSVTGMAEILEKLHIFNSWLPISQRNDAKPSVILSLLTPELKNLPDYRQALEKLGRAYPALDDQTMTEGVEWLEFEFVESLMSISTLRQALDILKKSNLFKASEQWAAASDSESYSGQSGEVIRVARKADAKKLKDICEKVQFAEKVMSSPMLVTEPLRNMGKHFSAELPNLVSVGAKGAGKTFTFLQAFKAKTWHSFLNLVNIKEIGVMDAVIFPILWSENLSSEVKKEILKSQNDFLNHLDLEQKAIKSTEISKQIKLSLTSPPAHWDEFWDKLIFKQFIIPNASIEALNEYLFTKKKSVIFIFDGIEDAFDDPSTEAARDAIASLLKLPNRLAELTDRRIGAMVFVRSDYLQLAIRQNPRQFLDRFSSFQLNWSAESFLRLTYWLCGLAEIIEADTTKAEVLSVNDLLQDLQRLWGKKLGKTTSKEAHSARWVFASLCDLKGNFQARDLVRFLRFAAEIEMQKPDSLWSDRVLAPESMRTAIPQCSKDKVSETATEIAFFRDWKNRLDEKSIHPRKVPFSAEAMALDTQQLIALRDLGVIYEDINPDLGDERLYLPEIYRAGLGFEISATGRPRTMALLKKNLGAIPF